MLLSTFFVFKWNDSNRKLFSKKQNDSRKAICGIELSKMIDHDGEPKEVHPSSSEDEHAHLVGNSDCSMWSTLGSGLYRPLLIGLIDYWFISTWSVIDDRYELSWGTKIQTTSTF